MNRHNRRRLKKEGRVRVTRAALIALENGVFDNQPAKRLILEIALRTENITPSHLSELTAAAIAACDGDAAAALALVTSGELQFEKVNVQ